MLYDRTENEQALEAQFARNSAGALPEPLTNQLTFLVHFCAQDVALLRESVQGSINLFLPPNWYEAAVVLEEMGTDSGGSLGDVLRKGLAGSAAGAIIPIHCADFFTCVRQQVFEATLGERHFHILGRLRMHELAGANFLDADRFPTGRISDLTGADFEWLFEQSFSMSQQRAVVTAYVDAMYGGHVPSTFDHWRRDAEVYFPRYFRQFGSDIALSGGADLEPPDRPDTERRIVNWYADKLKAQIASWNNNGWPVLDDEGAPDQSH